MQLYSTHRKLGKEEGEANESWCPDCVIADPMVRKWLNKVPESLLIEAPCSKSDYKGNPNHEYKIHPLFKIQWIPTLYEWKQGELTKTLTDDDLNEEKLQEFIL